MICSSSVKNAIGNLIGIALNLEIALGSIVIFTMLILPMQGHNISFHLFVCSSVLSSASYSFQSTGLLPLSIGLFLGIFFNAIVNWSVSLVSLSDISLSVYRNATDFCIFILYQQLYQIHW